MYVSVTLVLGSIAGTVQEGETFSDPGGAPHGRSVLLRSSKPPAKRRSSLFLLRVANVGTCELI